jgi:hypothetical protein
MIFALLAAQAISPTAEVRLKALDEMSGLARARRTGVFWTHNDSGDSARIFAIKSNGDAFVPPGASTLDFQGWAIEGAKNNDWEEIASDGKNLFVSDMGNNGNRRKDMGIYVFPEPRLDKPGPIKNAKFYPIRYADQTEFPPANYRYDCEAIFVKGGKIYLLTKHRAGQTQVPEAATNLYRFDPKKKNGIAEKVASLEKIGGWVTASGVSPNGKQLAVLTNAPVASVWLFRLDGPDKNWLKAGTQMKISGTRQAEAIAYIDANRVLISNEQRDLFELYVPPR